MYAAPIKNPQAPRVNTYLAPRLFLFTQVKGKYPHVLVEVSGGITEDTIGTYLGDGVDVVSVGALTQGYACLDYSLKVQK